MENELSSLQRRTQLQEELEGMLGSDQVHFQPNLDTHMIYPAIVYSRDSAYVDYADNLAYRKMDHYELTLIDLEPDSPVFDLLEDRPYTRHVRTFVSDGLNHYVFDLYHYPTRSIV